MRADASIPPLEIQMLCCSLDDLEPRAPQLTGVDKMSLDDARSAFPNQQSSTVLNMAVKFVPTAETLSFVQGFNVSVDKLGPCEALKWDLLRAPAHLCQRACLELVPWESCKQWS